LTRNFGAPFVLAIQTVGAAALYYTDDNLRQFFFCIFSKVRTGINSNEPMNYDTWYLLFHPIEDICSILDSGVTLPI
jgi:hypothetical protein